MELLKTKRVLKCFKPGCPQAQAGIRFTQSDVILDEAYTKKIITARRNIERKRARKNKK